MANFGLQTYCFASNEELKTECIVKAPNLKLHVHFFRVYLAEISSLDGDIINTTPVTDVSGDHGPYWNTERLTVEAEKNYRLVVEGRSGIKINY